MSGPICDEGVRVCADLCPTCIFRPGNLMHLRGGRVKSMVAAAQEADSAICCHEFLGEAEAVCRGWLDRFGPNTILGRLALIAPLPVDPKEAE